MGERKRLQGREMCKAAAQRRHGVVEWLADLVLSVRKMRWEVKSEGTGRPSHVPDCAGMMQCEVGQGISKETIWTCLLAVLGPWGVVKVVV